MKYIPYLIAKNPDGTYAVIFNPDSPPRLGMIMHGDMSIHSPYGTLDAAKERAESFGENGGFTALNVGLVEAAWRAVNTLDGLVNGTNLTCDERSSIVGLLRLRLPSVTPGD